MTVESSVPTITPETTIAVVGVSTDPQKYGHRIFADLVKAGYVVFGVNPKGGEVAGQPLYPSLADLPQVPDLVMTVVPPAVTAKVVAQCQELGIKQIWMQPGSESDEAVEAAQAAGIATVSQACFMQHEHLW